MNDGYAATHQLQAANWLPDWQWRRQAFGLHHEPAVMAETGAC
ncbi:MAG: hypothetical protein R3E95_05410 [Thiolinea sp.]